MINQNVLGRLRYQAARYLNATCDIYKEGKSYGPAGELIPIEINVGSGVPCRIIRAGSSVTDAIEEMASRETMPDFYQIILLADQEINIDYTIRDNGNLKYAVVRLEIQLTDNFFRTAVAVLRR